MWVSLLISSGGATPAFVRCARSTYFDKVGTTLNSGKRIGSDRVELEDAIAVGGTVMFRGTTGYGTAIYEEKVQESVKSWEGRWLAWPLVLSNV